MAEAWGLGGGQQLMEAALARLGAAGYQEVTLWVLDTNLRARAFYEAGGWRHDGTVKLDDRGDLVLRELRYQLAL